MRRTKIVCTIGPASDTEEMIAKLIAAGMNVARVNFSHGTPEYQRELVRKIGHVRVFGLNSARSSGDNSKCRSDSFTSRNERQKKPFETYNALLSNSFQGFHRVLRPERFLTLTFHNPTFKVRNATVHAGVFARFDYEHIHHQPLGQVSAKAMMQPFGSAQGDFYLRFAKTAQPARRMEEITEERFRRIVIETCRKVNALHNLDQPSRPCLSEARVVWHAPNRS